MKLAPIIIAAAGLLAATPRAATALEVGFNQGWVIDRWGRDLTTGFDAAGWRRVLQRTRQAGGSVLRVWLCEGLAKEGVVWAGTRPVGVDPAFLRNVQALADLARAERVRLYWTLFDGNWAATWPRSGVEAWRHYNILQDKYGEGTRFRDAVLAPLLDVIEAAADVTYALDLMNEVQGSVRGWWWSDGWSGARRWIAAWTRYVHARAPGVRVTASCGHHTAVDDVLAGRLDGLGLDFYDVHVYDDQGTIPRGWLLARHARLRGRSVVLGEFGQRSTTVDPGLQARAAASFLRNAAALGFEAALAWRVEDWQTNGQHFTFFERDGRERPAAAVVRQFVASQP